MSNAPSKKVKYNVVSEKTKEELARELKPIFDELNNRSAAPEPNDSESDLDIDLTDKESAFNSCSDIGSTSDVNNMSNVDEID